jgi:hypothetical protein
MLIYPIIAMVKEHFLLVSMHSIVDQRSVPDDKMVPFFMCQQRLGHPPITIQRIFSLGFNVPTGCEFDCCGRLHDETIGIH